MQQSEKKPTTWNGAGRFDPVNSTFKHVITMKTLKGELALTGYSKGLLGVESTDKIVLLERQILRFVNQGYLFGKHKKYQSETISIEYFLNGTYQGIPDEPLFTLYPDEYVFAKNSDYLEDVRLHTFLKRLYSQIKSNQVVTKSLSHKPALTTQAELFDFTKKRFKNEKDLLDWMQERIREGHARGIAFDYYIKYTAKWFESSR